MYECDVTVTLLNGLHILFQIILYEISLLYSPFKYSLEGMVLIINSPTTIYYYTSKRSFEIAFEIGKCSGPGGYAKERIGGASYVWAILHDKRINAFA